MNHDALTQHYNQLLGLPGPWHVQSVLLRLEAMEVCIRVERSPDVPLQCPDCGKECPGYDRSPPRRWRHLDSMQFFTYLEAEAPRCQCPEHGVKTVEVPWAKDRNRYTLLFEAFAIEVLLACRSVKKTASLLRLDWNAVHRIMKSAVAHGLAQRDLADLRQVGMDEKMVRCGVGFASILSDLKRGTVVEIAPGRTQMAAENCWKDVSAEVREQVECAAVDMAASFKAAIRVVAPNAEILIDKFHVSQLVSKAVDETRRAEQAEQVAAGNTALKESRYLWLFNSENMTDLQWNRFEQVYAVAKETAKAWTLKEALVDFWQCKTTAAARRYFKEWSRKALDSGLAAMARVAKSLRKHLEAIIAYFKYRVTNAGAEALNSLIQSLQGSARGYRNFANLRVAILFFHGGLTLVKVPHP